MNNYERTILNLVERVTRLEEEVDQLKKGLGQEKRSTKKDKTRYLYNGSTFLKNRLVLSVVKDFVKDNSDLSFEALEEVFDKSLQGSLGVVRIKDEVEKYYQDAKKRFFMKPEEIIKLAGEDVVVCSQWGIGNIDRFIRRAENLGLDIEPIH